MHPRLALQFAIAIGPLPRPPPTQPSDSTARLPLLRTVGSALARQQPSTLAFQ
ncbi:hypothetical protein BCR44DRAFT_42122 [Catenaria anguillulae PL171]|uniref:Uncharacterized protein n=1 Tax=Catenaria anguillulae PL171 TaxID=765915 RepID=A0A1Y2H794_9FUNG|nr:hypothetical protein BCR44DRAFT_42122 [Catenaria anguillulae PL171]